MPRLVNNVCLSAISIVLSFVIIEAFSRVYLNSLASKESFRKYASLKQLQKRYGLAYTESGMYSFHRYLGYYPTPNYRKGPNKHNSLGFRGEEISALKPDGEFRIVCLGGSTTYTAMIKDYQLTYPYLLEKELNTRNYKNVRVVNAGASAYSSWESLINFQFRVLDLDPDMIIVYHGINDIHARLVWPPEAYKGDNSGSKSVTFSRIFMPSILEYSTLFRFFMIRAGWVTPHYTLSRTFDQRHYTSFSGMFDRQKRKGAYPSGIFKRTSAFKMLKINRPRYFERNIENIIEIAKQKKVIAVLATFAYSGLFKDEPRVSSPEYVFAYGEMNGVLKELAKHLDVHLFDFYAAFPKEHRYYIDGRHVSVEGSKLKAKLFADYIITTGLLRNDK